MLGWGGVGWGGVGWGGVGWGGVGWGGDTLKWRSQSSGSLPFWLFSCFSGRVSMSLVKPFAGDLRTAQNSTSKWLMSLGLPVNTSKEQAGPPFFRSQERLLEGCVSPSTIWGMFGLGGKGAEVKVHLEGVKGVGF